MSSTPASRHSMIDKLSNRRESFRETLRSAELNQIKIQKRKVHLQNLERRQLCESYDKLLNNFKAIERPTDLFAVVHDMWSIAVLPGEPRASLFQRFSQPILAKLVGLLRFCQVGLDSLLSATDQSALQQKLLTILSNFYSMHQELEASPQLIHTLLGIATGSEQSTSRKAWVCLLNISNQRSTRHQLLAGSALLKALAAYDVATHAEDLLCVLAVLTDNLPQHLCRQCLEFLPLLEKLYAAPQNQQDVLLILAQLFKFKTTDYLTELLSRAECFLRHRLGQLSTQTFPEQNKAALCVLLKECYSQIPVECAIQPLFSKQAMNGLETLAVTQNCTNTRLCAYSCLHSISEHKPELLTFQPSAGRLPQQCRYLWALTLLNVFIRIQQGPYAWEHVASLVVSQIQDSSENRVELIITKLFTLLLQRPQLLGEFQAFEGVIAITQWYLRTQDEDVSSAASLFLDHFAPTKSSWD